MVPSTYKGAILIHMCTRVHRYTLYMPLHSNRTTLGTVKSTISDLFSSLLLPTMNLADDDERSSYFPDPYHHVQQPLAHIFAVQDGSFF